MVIEAKKTALIVVDLWDKHYCETYGAQVDGMARRLNPFLDLLHDTGVPVIFMNADVFVNHKHEVGARLLSSYSYGFKKPEVVPTPRPDGLPGWGSTCACLDKICPVENVWTRIHPGVARWVFDLVGDWQMHLAFLKKNKIETVLYAGGATNICVLDTRDFSIWQTQACGYKTVLLEDLTEPYLPGGHVRLPETLEYYREHICPTVRSHDLRLTGHGGWPGKIFGNTYWR